MWCVVDNDIIKQLINKISIKVETKYGVQQIITIICVTCVQKDFQIRTLDKQLSISTFHEIAPNFTYPQKL